MFSVGTQAQLDCHFLLVEIKSILHGYGVSPACAASFPGSSPAFCYPKAASRE